MDRNKWQPAVESFGKTLIDIGKLAIGSLVFGSIIRNDSDTARLMLAGGVAAAVLIIAGTLASTMIR